MTKLHRIIFTVTSLVLLLIIGSVTVSAESGESPATAFSFTYDEEKTNTQSDGDNEIMSSPMTGDNGYTGSLVLMAVSGAYLIATTYAFRKSNTGDGSNTGYGSVC